MYSWKVFSENWMEVVPTIDLAALVRRVACPGDWLGMHLDIEGAEYEVVPHLLSRGVACWFRRGRMTIEWHETNRRSAATAARERERLLGALRACGVTVRREV